LVIFCVAVDQGTKYWATTVLQPIRDLPLWDGVLHLTYSRNTGMAFSMLSEHTWLLTLVSGLLVAGMLVFYFLKRRSLPVFLQVVLAMVVGGGIGNLIDRIAYGYVVDFIYVKIIDFAIFNGADSFVVVGCVLMMLYLLFAKEEEKPGLKHDANS